MIQDPIRTFEGEGFKVYLVLEPGYVLGANHLESERLVSHLEQAAGILGLENGVMRQADLPGGIPIEMPRCSQACCHQELES